MSMNGWPAGAAIFVSATICPSFRLLRFRFLLSEHVEERVEALVAFVPEGLVAREPVGRFPQRGRAEMAQPCRRATLATDQPGLLQDLEMPRDRRLRDRERRSELSDRQIAGGLRQAGEDCSPRGVRQRTEDRGERV